MRITIIAFALIFSRTTYGQVIKELQIIINPTYSTRLLDTKKEAREVWNKEEKGMISYDAGILICPFTKNRISIGTGLIYSRKGYVWSDRTGQDINTGDPVHIKITETVNYLEIPIKLTYYLSDKSKTYLISGISNDIFLSSKVKVTNDPTTPTQYDIRRYNLGINIGLGHNFKISESMKVGVEPNIKFQTMNYIDKDTPAKRYLYTIGLAINTKIGL